MGLPDGGTDIVVNIASATPPTLNGAVTVYGTDGGAAHSFIYVAAPSTGTGTVQTWDPSGRAIQATADIVADTGTTIQLSADITYRRRGSARGRRADGVPRDAERGVRPA